MSVKKNSKASIGHGSPGRPLSVQSKFLLGVGFILFCFCIVSAFLIYLHERSLLEEAAVGKSRLVLAAVESTRRFVRDELRPKMTEVLGPEAFVLEAMSTSYVGRAVMDRFNESQPDYQYRRVAINARNPRSTPSEIEFGMIKFFEANPRQENWQGIVQMEGRAHFLHSRPVYFTSHCLRCHGRPEDAPAALLELYGRNLGFGHREGEIAGVSTVSIPVDVALAKIKEKATVVFGVSFLVLSLLFVIIGFLFNRVVVSSLRELLDTFRQGLRDETELELLKEAKAKDEIGELTAAAEVMSGHLAETREQLAEYTENLEMIVAQRTRALKDSQLVLEEKITARNRELTTLNTIAELITRSTNLREILPKVLTQTLRLIPAEGAALYLLRDDPPCLELQYHDTGGKLDSRVIFTEERVRSVEMGEVPDLPSSLVEAAIGRMNFFPCKINENCLNVPLTCRGKVSGVMTFVGVNFREITPEMRQLLLSIGQQIGITVESLQNVEQLVRSKDLLQSVFDGITDMLVLLDREGRVKMVNKAYALYCGGVLDESPARPAVGLETVSFSPLSLSSLNNIIASKNSMTEEVSGGAGEIFLIHYYPIMDDHGEVTSIICYLKDVTVAKQVESRIQQTEKLASLGQMAAGVAHEINNPLSVILCFVDLLKRQLADFPQGLNDLSVIEKHSRSCQKIVADLLGFARGQGTERKPADLNQTIRDVITMVAPQFRRKHCEIDFQPGAGLPLVRIDGDKMRQVFLNLFMNARQAMNGKGLIGIETRLLKKERQVEIVVTDNGSGIKPEIMGKIFDPFFSTKKTGEGTGLGLSVSYGIIQDHGGDIRVESVPLKGTRFTLNLPLDDNK